MCHIAALQVETPTQPGGLQALDITGDPFRYCQMALYLYRLGIRLKIEARIATKIVVVTVRVVRK